MQKLVLMGLLMLLGQPMAAVLVPDKLWPAGSRLTVWLMDGDPFAQQLVESTASKWSQYGNISFEFYTQRPKQGSHIRVSFKGYDGSLLGAHNQLNEVAPTVQLPSVLDPKLSLEYKKRIILHEFGHVLGFEHEYRHPYWPYGDDWLRIQAERCSRMLTEHSGLEQIKQRCDKINQRLSIENSLWLPFDERSIMNYPVAAEWLDNREEPIEAAMELSHWDKIAVALVYPWNTDAPSHHVRFYNQCHEPVTVRWKDKVSQGISSGVQQVTLNHLQSSDAIELAESNVLHFYAIDRTGRHRWFNDETTNPLVALNLNFLHRGEKKIPLYCD